MAFKAGATMRPERLARLRQDQAERKRELILHTLQDAARVLAHAGEAKTASRLLEAFDLEKPHSTRAVRFAQLRLEMMGTSEASYQAASLGCAIEAGWV